MENKAKYLYNPNLSRCEAVARYIIDTQDTVRGAAKIFGVSKSTVHKDLTRVLKRENRTLYLQAKQVLEQNKSQRHIRGGMATRDKYRNMREKDGK